MKVHCIEGQMLPSDLFVEVVITPFTEKLFHYLAIYKQLYSYSYTINSIYLKIILQSINQGLFTRPVARRFARRPFACMYCINCAAYINRLCSLAVLVYMEVCNFEESERLE